MAGRAFENADYLSAQRHYEDALGLMERNGQDQSEEALQCFKNLASIYYSDGNLDKAIATYSRLVVASETLYGESHRDVISNMFILAKVCDSAGASEDAASIYDRVQRLASQHLPKGDILIKHIREARELRTGPQKEFKQKVTTLALPKPVFREMTDALGSGAEPGGRQHFFKKNQILFSTVGSLLLFVLAWAWFNWLAGDATIKAPSTGMIQESFKVEGQKFRTPDGNIVLTVKDNSNANLTTPSEKIDFTYKTIDFSIEGIQTLVGGAFARKEYWIEQTPLGLLAQNSLVLHTDEAPEVKTVERMRELGRHLQEIYGKQGSYPMRLEKWTADPMMRWTNPVNQQRTIPTYQVLNKYQVVFVGFSKVEDFPKQLAAGEHWANEPMPDPGGMHTFSLQTEQKIEDDYRIAHVFMQGFDRNGEVLKSSIPGQFYFLELVPGEEFEMPKQTNKEYYRKLCATLSGARVYFVKEGSSILGLLPLKYTIPFILGSMTGIFIVMWAAIDAQKRVTNKKMFPTALEGIIVLTALVWLAWFVTRLIP